MLKTRESFGSYNNYPVRSPPQPSYTLPQDFLDTSNKQRFQTVESRYSRAPYLNDPYSSSTRNVSEGVLLPNDYERFQAEVLKRVESIEQQTNQVLENKQRQLYFIRIDLQNSEERLKNTEQLLINKDQEIQELIQQISVLKNNSFKFARESKSQDLKYLRDENQKLKESLDILIQEKNEISKIQSKKDYYHHENVQGLKREVEELRAMVSQMEKMVFNCPSCFSLKREVEQLNDAYGCLIKEHTEVRKTKKDHERQLLKDIHFRIQENQNIMRENTYLSKEKTRKPYFKHKRERMTESVAKRCRTLTDQF